jgi:hypothetical protein
VPIIKPAQIKYKNSTNTQEKTLRNKTNNNNNNNNNKCKIFSFTLRLEGIQGEQK